MKKVDSFPFDGKIRKSLVGALLVDPKRCRWPIEMKMTKTLLTQHPDPYFWHFLAKSYKFQSLMNLIAQKDIIFEQFLEYTKLKTLALKGAPQIELADKKLGEDIIIEKQQTLMDFIK